MNNLTLACTLALSAAAAPHFNACPKDFKPMETLDVNRYAGKWFEISKDKYTPFELASGCTFAV